MQIERTLTVPRPVEEVFAYVADFTTTEEWDAGTIRTTRIAGDGGIGTQYRNVSRFLGRQTELTYVVEEHDSPRRFRVRGENKTVTTHDTITLSPLDTGGTQLHYLAEFEFSGPSRLVAPLLAPAFKRLGDHSEQGLRDALR